MFNWIGKVLGFVMTVLGILLLVIITSPIWVYLLAACTYAVVVLLGLLFVMGIILIPVLLIAYGVKWMSKR